MTWLLPVIAVTVLAFAAVSRRLEGTADHGGDGVHRDGAARRAKSFGLVEPNPSGETVKLLAEATLAVVLFGDAARIDLERSVRSTRCLRVCSAVGLPLTIAAGFGVALLVFPSLGWPEALLLAVILAPTDAALGQAVVTLPSLPSRVRQGLNVESGLNDGLCVPVFVVVLAVASAEAGIVSEPMP